MKQLILCAALALCGCAHRYSDLTLETSHSETADGTVTDTERRRVRESGTAAGDARNALEKFRATNGKTLSVGFAGEEQTASTTNIVQALQEMRKTAEALSPK